MIKNRLLRCRHWSIGVFVFAASMTTLFLLLNTSGKIIAKADQPSPNLLSTISGKVMDPQGNPLAGMNVVLLQRRVDSSDIWVETRIVSTTVTGTYAHIGLGANLYKIQVRDPDQLYGFTFYSNTSAIEEATNIVVTGQSVDNVNVTMSLGASVTGRVSILNEITPTNGYVSLWQKLGEKWSVIASVNYTSTGRYELHGIPNGTYRLYCTGSLFTDPYGIGENFWTYYGGATIESALDIVLKPGDNKTDIDLNLGEFQNDTVVSGTVTEKGRPVPGIRVELYRTYYTPVENGPLAVTTYTNTDSAGNYVFGGIGYGVYYIGFVDPTKIYATSYYSNSHHLRNATFLDLKDGDVIANVNATMVKAASISGSVRRRDGSPVAFAQVSYSMSIKGNFFEQRSLQADKMGNFAFFDLWPGEYQVCFFDVILGGECYGQSSNTSGEPDILISVGPGDVITGVDQILGPDFTLFLPTVLR